MAKETHWHLRGWTYQDRIDAAGTARPMLVYTGEYYSFGLSNRGLRLLKLVYMLLTLALFGMYIAFSLADAPGGREFYAGAFILALIPFIYLGLGVCNLMPAKSQMTYRSYFASCKRIQYATYFAAPLLGLGLLGQLIHVIRLSGVDGASVSAADLFCLFGAAFCTADALALIFLQHRHPAKMIISEADSTF